MVRPFDIEEIFPEAVAGPARRPRQQPETSAQGLAVTLIADYSTATRAWLPSAAIVALLADFGVTSGAARTSISRLSRRGVIETSRHGRFSSYRLTDGAATDLSNGGAAIARDGTDPGSWDESWTIVLFSIPEQESTRRRALRDHLRWSRFAPLYDGAWISPDPLPPSGRAALAAAALGSVTVFRARYEDLQAGLDRHPVEAWDLPAIAKEYETFIDRYASLLPRVADGAITGATAVRTRTEVMNVYRRFPILDPMIPDRLMPAGWPRARARDVFVAIYDGLLEPAQHYVRTIVSGSTGAPCPDVQAHTVAAMAAGVRRTATITDLRRRT